MKERLTPCQHCGDAWIDEHWKLGLSRVVCTCGAAQKRLPNWYKTKAEAIREWNKVSHEW